MITPFYTTCLDFGPKKCDIKTLKASVGVTNANKTNIFYSKNTKDAEKLLVGLLDFHTNTYFNK